MKIFIIDIISFLNLYTYFIQLESVPLYHFLYLAIARVNKFPEGDIPLEFRHYLKFGNFYR